MVLLGAGNEFCRPHLTLVACAKVFNIVLQKEQVQKNLEKSVFNFWMANFRSWNWNGKKVSPQVHNYVIKFWELLLFTLILIEIMFDLWKISIVNVFRKYCGESSVFT